MLPVLLIVTGCGRVGFTPRDDTSTTTADTPPGPSLVVVSELSEASVAIDDPSLTPDLLEIFYQRGLGGAQTDIYTATRATTNEPFGPGQPITSIDTTFNDGSPEISSDGLTMYFSSDRAASPDIDIWMTTRPSRGAAWSAPVSVTELNSAGNDFSGAMDGTERRIIIAKGAGSARDLYEATRGAPTDPWGTPVALSTVNSSAEDGVPFLDEPGTRVYFVSQRPGTGGRDLWMAIRSTPTDAFAAPVEIVDLNTTGEDSDPWASADGHHIFFSSDRGGILEIYHSIR